MTSSTATNSVNAPFAIAIHDLSKRFNREWIFKHLGFTFLSGNTYAVTGPNGSGKSTLLQVVWGQIPQTSGTIRYHAGETEIPPDEIYRHISIATPYMDLIDEFSLDEMLAFHFSLKEVRPGCRVSDLPRIMYLDEARDKQLVNFSSGMKQRLKLAMAFYTKADIYFFDEPGTNLDKRAFEWYLEELGKLASTAIIFIASNNPDEYPKNATRLDILDFKR